MSEQIVQMTLIIISSCKYHNKVTTMIQQPGLKLPAGCDVSAGGDHHTYTNLGAGAGERGTVGDSLWFSGGGVAGEESPSLGWTLAPIPGGDLGQSV